MIVLAVAVFTAATAASPATRQVLEPPANACDYREYYLPFPPTENGVAPTAPVINGQREKDDSFVVTVRRRLCRGRQISVPGIPTRWVDDPSQHFVTWSATVTPTTHDRASPPSSFLKGPTIKMGPDGETLMSQPK